MFINRHYQCEYYSERRQSKVTYRFLNSIDHTSVGVSTFNVRYIPPTVKPMVATVLTNLLITYFKVVTHISFTYSIVSSCYITVPNAHI